MYSRMPDRLAGQRHGGSGSGSGSGERTLLVNNPSFRPRHRGLERVLVGAHNANRGGTNVQGAEISRNTGLDSFDMLKLVSG